MKHEFEIQENSRSVIWKYQLEVEYSQEIQMPKDARILTVQLQGPLPVIWAVVNPNAPLENRQIITYGTGTRLSKGVVKYIGTYMTTKGKFVGHVFERVA